MNPKRLLPSVVIMLVLLSQLIPSASPGVKQASAAAICDWAGFVMDVTVPDGTTLAVNTPFTKTWRLKNIGTCTWTTAYKIVYVNGDMMSAPFSVPMPATVAPGATVDVSVQMMAPPVAGHFRGNWKLMNASGTMFGIGSSASSVFWVDINVASPMVEAFDFVAYWCGAAWFYNGGPIPCPKKDSVKQYGYVDRIESPILENGQPGGAPGLLTVPQQKYNGIIMGVFPEMDIFPGDRFQSIVSCQYNAVDCYVTFELDYLKGSELVTIWKFREKYDGSFYRADVDLTRFAWLKHVKLVLIVSAYGPAMGDFPLWVAPRLVRPYSPPPTATPTITPTATATLPPSACDKAEFVQDVTVPDGTTFAPGQAFTKTWRLKNVGTCTWSSSYSLAFTSGELMGGAASSPLPGNVAPGQTVDVSAYLTAPSTSGPHEGSWMLRNPSGGFFGIGASGTNPFWVRINVSGGSSSGYDFVTNLCSAAWTSGAGALPCPGTDGSATGFALRLDNPLVENGTTDARLAILTSPQAIDYGWIQGAYPSYVVQSGDRFQATIACQYNATLCDVFYRLDYQIGSGPVNTLWSFRGRYDGISDNVDVDLASLVGQNVRFILTVLANGPSTNDRALWIAPRIVNSGGATPTTVTDTPTPVPTTDTPIPPTATPIPPTATPTPDPYAGWGTYSDSVYGFAFRIPPGSTIGTGINNATRIFLPFTSGTNLMEKYVDVTATENASVCNAGQSMTSETVTINGIQFLKQTAMEGAAGNLYNWYAYSAYRPGTTVCVTMMFVLHSISPGAMETPLPTFDLAAESAVIDTIMSTFGWSGTGTVDFATFGQTVVNGLNARNFDAVKALMHDTFVFGFWQSQGSSYSPDLAIQQLQANYIGAAPALIPNPGQDLTVLLGGSNPYAIMGLDPANSQALFISGWGLNGSDQAILYFTRLPDGSPYWHSVLIANGGFPGSSSFNPPVGSAAFCADPQATNLLLSLETAVKTSNGDLLASLVSANHGVDVRLWHYGNTVNYNTTQARSAFTDSTAIDWGVHPGSLLPTIGTFTEKVLPTLVDVFAPTRQFKCNDSNVLTLTNTFPWNVNFYQIFRPATTGIDFDMNYWLVGMEYIGGKPYLYGMIHHIWTP